ncbi:MAG: hypothetical protein K2W96_10755 [Gemmataceae bacterium]|nr:hypothetical protein [Gemmataceae bacterium]
MTCAVLLLMMTTPFPGGLADGERTAYVAGPKGIDALDLETGEARWRSPHAQKPLFAAGDTLFCLALESDSLAVVGLDKVGKGEVVFRSRPIETPRWADPAGAAGQSFAVAWSQEKRTLVLSWQARLKPRVGRGKEAHGSVRIDLLSGKTEPLAEARHAAPPLALPKLLEKLSVRWHRTFGGQVLAVTEEEAGKPGDRTHRLLLRTWDERTGKEAAAKELVRGGRPALLRGLDGLHLWVRDAGTRETEEPAGWQVYSSLDGHAVAQVPFVAGTSQAVLLGGRAYVVAGASGRAALEGNGSRAYVLHALDLETGKASWTWPLSRHAAE